MDKNIKRVTVPIEDLPAWGFEESQHLVRYRIISDDRTRFTHWSPFFKLTNDGIRPGTGYIDPTNPVVPDPEQPDLVVADYVDLIWNTRVSRDDGDDDRKQEKGPYDVFVRWIADAEILGSDYAMYPFELLVSNYTGNSLKVKTVPTLNDEVSTAVEFIVQKYKKPKKNQKPQVNLEKNVFRSEIISLIIPLMS